MMKVHGWISVDQFGEHNANQSFRFYTEPPEKGQHNHHSDCVIPISVPATAVLEITCGYVHCRRKSDW